MTKQDRPNPIIYYGVLIFSAVTGAVSLFFAFELVAGSYERQQHINSGSTPDYYMQDNQGVIDAPTFAFDTANAALHPQRIGSEIIWDDTSDKFTKMAWWDFENSIKGLPELEAFHTGNFSETEMTEFLEDDLGNKTWVFKMPLYREQKNSGKYITLKIGQEHFAGKDLKKMITSWSIK